MERQHHRSKSLISKLPKYTGRESRSASTSRADVESCSKLRSVDRLPRSRSFVRQTPVHLQIPCNVPCSRNRSAERPKHKKKDCRPLTDKHWQATHIAKTQKYLQSIAPHLLNNGTKLRPMTLNMFVEITNFLLRKIFAVEELTMTNYVDTLPTILNTLKYPGLVSPSTLKTANTMHSWPHILGILSWLAEVHRLLELPERRDLSTVSPEASVAEKIKNLKLVASLRAYREWNNDVDTTYIEETLRENFMQLLGVSPEKLEQARKTKEADAALVKQHDEQLQTDGEELKQIEQKYLQLNLDLQATNSRTEQQKDIVKKLDETCENKLQSIRNIEQENEAMELKIEEIKKKVKSQKMSVAERNKIVEEINELKNKAALRMKTREHKQSLANEKDLRLSQLKKHLGQIICEHNISLIRPALQHPELGALRLPEDRFMSRDMIQVLDENTKLKENLLSKLTKEKDIVDENLKMVLSNKEAAQKNLDNRASAIEKKRSLIAEKKKEIASLKDNHEKEMQQINNDVIKSRETCKEVSTEISALHCTSETFEKELAKYTAKAELLEKTQPELEKKMLSVFKAIEQSTYEEFSQMDTMMLSIDDSLNAKLQELRDQ